MTMGNTDLMSKVPVSFLSFAQVSQFGNFETLFVGIFGNFETFCYNLQYFELHACIIPMFSKFERKFAN